MEKLLDSIAKVYNTREKYLQELLIIATRSHIDIPIVPGTEEQDYFPPVDSCPPQIKNMRGTFATRWHTAKVQLGDSAYLQLESRDTITGIWKTVKEGNIFKRKEYLQFDINFADTSRKVTHMTTYRKLKEIKQTSIVLGADLMLLNRSMHTMLGVGVKRSTPLVDASLWAGKDFTTDHNIIRDYRVAPWYGKVSLHLNIIKF